MEILAIWNLKHINELFCYSPLVYLTFWMALLFMLCLENIGSHSYADFPNVDTFCYKIEKKKKSCSVPLSSEKAFSTEKLSSSWGWIQFFHNSDFLLKALTLWSVTLLPVVFFEVRDCSIFEKTSTKHPNALKNHNLSVSHSDAPLNRRSAQLITPNNHMRTLPWDGHWAAYLACSRSAYLYFPLYHRDYWRGVLNGKI